MSLFLTPDEFCENEENVKALQDFLKSAPGKNLLSVLVRMRPEAVMADPRIGKDAGNLRAAAASACEGERAQYLLGRIEGHESVVRLLTDVLTLHQKHVPPASSKLGARRTEIKPHPPTT